MPCTEFQKDAVLRNTAFRPHTAATLQRLGNAEFLGEQTRVVGSNRQLKKKIETKSNATGHMWARRWKPWCSQ